MHVVRSVLLVGVPQSSPHAATSCQRHLAAMRVVCRRCLAGLSAALGGALGPTRDASLLRCPGQVMTHLLLR
jgi:hypothetical protein